MLFSPRSPSGAEVLGVDKVIHALLFGSLAAATAARFRRGLSWVLVYAIVSELLQAVLPIHRDGSAWDAVADAIGALMGWVAVMAVMARGSAHGPDPQELGP